MSQRKIAKGIIRQSGGCEGIGCRECILTIGTCGGRENNITLAKQWLKDHPKNKPSIDILITKALNSTEFIDKVAEALMNVQSKDAVFEATEHVIEYPYVGVTESPTKPASQSKQRNQNDSNSL